MIFKERAAARGRKAQQPDTVGKTTQFRVIVGDGATVEFRGKCETGVDIERRRPGRVERQIRAELIDLGRQPLFDVTCVVVDQHGIAQKSGQAIMALVPVSRIGRRARDDGITLDRGQIEVI